MVKKLYWQKKQDLEVLKHQLQADRVVISSTDTIYGFLANITKDGFDGICKLKGIGQNGACDKRPFLILVSHKDLMGKLAKFVDIASISEKTLKFIESCWPGPVTFIFREKTGSFDFLSGGKETIAIRCPNHEGLQAILTDFDGLFSTSANKTGMPAPAKFENIDQSLLDSVNYVVLDEQEKLPVDGLSADTIGAKSGAAKASTIIDLSCPDYAQDFPFTLVREGDFSLVALQEIYNSIK